MCGADLHIAYARLFADCRFSCFALHVQTAYLKLRAAYLELLLFGDCILDSLIDFASHIAHII